MDALSNRTALVTGGASGIGLGISRAFLRAGMNVVLLDVRRAALESALHSLGRPPGAAAIALDVRDRDAWAEALAESRERFGNVHVLAGNAGVVAGSPVDEVTFDDWDFVSGVNIDGVVNGVLTILPHLLEHGEGGHLLATSSTSGVAAVAGGSLYCATKYAVCGFMEAVATDLRDTGIEVSILLPGPVATDLSGSTGDLRGRSRAPAPDADAPVSGPSFLMSPDEVGDRVVRGIRRGDLYIVTHGDFAGAARARHDALERAQPADPPNVALVDAFQGAPTFLRNPLYDRQHDVPAFPAG